MRSEHHSRTLDLVDFFQLETEDEIELEIEFTNTTWTETEEFHGFYAEREESETSDETYSLNGEDIKLSELEKKYGKREMAEAINYLIEMEIG